jgi:hypothetical protein
VKSGSHHVLCLASPPTCWAACARTPQVQPRISSLSVEPDRRVTIAARDDTWSFIKIRRKCGTTVHELISRTATIVYLDTRKQPFSQFPARVAPSTRRMFGGCSGGYAEQRGSGTAGRHASLRTSLGEPDEPSRRQHRGDRPAGRTRLHPDNRVGGRCDRRGQLREARNAHRSRRDIADKLGQLR